MPKLMIVDDEPYIRDFWKRILGDQKDFILTYFHSGEEAFEYYQHHWQEVDLIVLDMQMPYIGGAEAFKQFKQINSQVRCLVTTGFSIDESTQELFDGNSHVSFLGKPFRPEEGTEAVFEALK